MLNCIDNSGASLVECVMIVGRKRHASIGTSQPTSFHRPPRTVIHGNLPLEWLPNGKEKKED